MAFYRNLFPSLRAATQWTEATPRTWRYDGSTSYPTEHRWDLNTGYEGALKLAREGWQEGAQNLAQGLVRLPALDAMPELSHAVAGFFPDVGRYCTGIPDCMWNMNEQEGGKPVITLAVQINARSDVSAQCMSNYGLAIARYVDEMEAAGYSVEVIAAMCTIIKGDRLVQGWTVKNAGEPMNLPDMAFSIGHPAAFRRLGFALRERSEAKPCSSYGTPGTLAATDFDVPVIALTGMPSADSHSRTPESALENLKRVLDAAIAEQV